MAAKILDGKQIAKDYRQGLQDQVEALKEKGFALRLSVILVGNDGADQSYARPKKRAAEKIGMISEIVHLEGTATKEEVLNELNRLNNNDSISDISVQVPLPKQVSGWKILETINLEKDVDGFHPINIGKLYIDEQTFVPCIPLGIMEMLKHTDIDLGGRSAVVIGRSHIIGQPISKLLLQKNASVTVSRSRSKDMTSYLRDADVIVDTVGKPGLTIKDVVKEGAVIIDVDNTSDGNSKLKGDADCDAIKEIAGVITPAPGGVGPLTITMVLDNALLAERMRQGIDS